MTDAYTALQRIEVGTITELTITGGHRIDAHGGIDLPALSTVQPAFADALASGHPIGVAADMGPGTLGRPGGHRTSPHVNWCHRDGTPVTAADLLAAVPTDEFVMVMSDWVVYTATLSARPAWPEATIRLTDIVTHER